MKLAGCQYNDAVAVAAASSYVVQQQQQQSPININATYKIFLRIKIMGRNNFKNTRLISNKGIY